MSLLRLQNKNTVTQLVQVLKIILYYILYSTYSRAPNFLKRTIILLFYVAYSMVYTLFLKIILDNITVKERLFHYTVLQIHLSSVFFKVLLLYLKK
jgi:hypothetical protein